MSVSFKHWKLNAVDRHYYNIKEKRGVSSSCCHTTVTRLKPSRLLAHGQSQKTQREVFLPLFIQQQVVCFTKQKIAQNLPWKREDWNSLLLCLMVSYIWRLQCSTGKQ